MADCKIKNHVKIIKDLDKADPLQNEVKIVRISGVKDPSHRSIETVSYNANDYSTADLNCENKAIVVRD